MIIKPGQRFLSPEGTYLANKVCTCNYYLAKPFTVCYRQCEGERFGYACPPPPCRICNLWPPQFVRKCHNCHQTFYGWFGPFLNCMETYNGQETCWDCLKENYQVGPPKPTWRYPPECVLPDTHLLTLEIVEL